MDAVGLSDLITEPVDYLKVDIEGSEFGVLKDLCATGKMGLVKYLSCELHGTPAVQDQVAGTVDGAFTSGLPHHGQRGEGV